MRSSTVLSWILEILEILYIVYEPHWSIDRTWSHIYPIPITVLEPARDLQQANQSDMSSDFDAPVEDQGEGRIRLNGVNENVKLDQGDIMRTGKRPSELNR